MMIRDDGSRESDPPPGRWSSTTEPMGTADEAVLHHREHDRMGSKAADCVDDGVIQAGLPACCFQTRLVGLEVGKLERVGRPQFQVDELVTGLQQIFDPFARPDAEVISALGTDLQVGLEIGLEDHLAALRAANPEAFRADGPFFVVDDLVLFAFKPAHALRSAFRVASTIVAGGRGWRSEVVGRTRSSVAYS